MRAPILFVATALMAAAGFTGNASAAPVTMMFEVAPPSGTVLPATPYSEVGFTLANSPGLGGDGIFDAALGSFNTNGTDVFGWSANPADAITPITITLTETGGAAFNFLSFDAAVLQGVSNVIDVIGHLSGGGTVTTTITQTVTWTNYALGYLDVTSVDFVYGPGHLGGPNHHAFDNLTMEVVPEPGTGLLVIAGMVGLAGWRRERN